MLQMRFDEHGNPTILLDKTQRKKIREAKLLMDRIALNLGADAAELLLAEIMAEGKPAKDKPAQQAAPAPADEGGDVEDGIAMVGKPEIMGLVRDAAHEHSNHGIE